MKFLPRLVQYVLLATLAVAGLQTHAAENPFLGYWTLHLPGGGPGWLSVSGDGDDLKAEMLWGSGNVRPLNSAKIADGKLVGTRAHDTLTATLDGDNIKFVRTTPNPDGTIKRDEFSGQRQPPLPAAPDLSQIKFGAPMPLLNGSNLDGWQLTEPGMSNGWHMADGILRNDVVKIPGQEHHFGNLRTVAEFEDFSLHAEARVPKAGNSGIFLRGVYEVQVFDSFGKPTDSHNMGAIYGRITPTVSAEKPPGEWQTLDIIFVNRHVTVSLNGTKIIDNQPVLGPTGGALWPEVNRPGPIYLQGDHTGIEYRNLVLRPVVKN